MSTSPQDGVTIDALDLMDIIEGDESIEITIATRADGGGNGKKSYRTTINHVLAVFGARRDNPNQVTASQTGAYTKEEIVQLLQQKLGVSDIAVNSRRLEGSSKQEVIDEARNGTVANSNKLGGMDASAYSKVTDLDQVLDTLTEAINEQAGIFTP